MNNSNNTSRHQEELNYERDIVAQRLTIVLNGLYNLHMPLTSEHGDVTSLPQAKTERVPNESELANNVATYSGEPQVAQAAVTSLKDVPPLHYNLEKIRADIEAA